MSHIFCAEDSCSLQRSVGSGATSKRPKMRPYLPSEKKTIYKQQISHFFLAEDSCSQRESPLQRSAGNGLGMARPRPRMTISSVQKKTTIHIENRCFFARKICVRSQREERYAKVAGHPAVEKISSCVDRQISQTTTKNNKNTYIHT